MAYTPKTADEIRRQAEQETKSYYDQLRLAAQQQQQSNDLRLAQQIAGLQATYDKQREASAKQYRQLYSQVDRQALSRGMQRSSYNAQRLANLGVEGAEAQQAIADQEAAAAGNLEDQRTQLAAQLAAQLNQYGAGEAADTLKRMNELEQQEYERGRDALAQDQWQQQFDYQKQQDIISQEQWQKQFEESVRQFNVHYNPGSSGSGGSGSGGSGSGRSGGSGSGGGSANGNGNGSEVSTGLSPYGALLGLNNFAKNAGTASSISSTLNRITNRTAGGAAPYLAQTPMQTALQRTTKNSRVRTPTAVAMK